MRTFRYVDPAGEHTITEQEIIDQYFPYFSARLKEMGKEGLISEEECIDNFVAIHWATEITPCNS